MKLQKVGKFASGFIDRLNTFYAFLLLVTCFTIFNALGQSQGVLEIFRADIRKKGHEDLFHKYMAILFDVKKSK